MIFSLSAEKIISSIKYKDTHWNIISNRKYNKKFDTSWPLKNSGIRDAGPYTVENMYITFDLTKT